MREKKYFNGKEFLLWERVKKNIRERERIKGGKNKFGRWRGEIKSMKVMFDEGEWYLKENEICP